MKNKTNRPYDGYADLWEYLSNTKKTVVMYGMGNGADKILSVMDKYSLNVSDFFASDGFVRGHSFHGKTVLSYSAVKEKYGADDLIVLLSFASSLPDVLDNVKRIASECELYAPDVPVCGNTLFNADFYSANKESFDAARALLADDESRRIFDLTVRYKLTGDVNLLFEAESEKDDVYLGLLDAPAIRGYADLGAYNGDTVRELLRYCPGLETAYAFEPDRRSFRKLCEYAENAPSSLTLHTLNYAAWSGDTTLTFGDEGNRNSGLFASGKKVDIPATSLDKILAGEGVDYIKYDVEGSEKEAIVGSERTITEHRPKLLVSLYHRSEDMFALPLQINALRPDYKLYLRRYPYVPAWDLNLICV